MQKDIKLKTKPKNNSIRKLDRRVVYTKNMKEKLLKRNRITHETEKGEDENEVNYASDTVMFTGERASVNTAYGIKDTAQFGYEKFKKYREIKKLQKEDSVSNEINQDNLIPDSKEKSISNSNKQKLLNEKTKIKNRTTNSEFNENKITNVSIADTKVNGKKSQEVMKRYSINKIRKNNFNNKKNNVTKTKNIARKSIDSIKKLAEKIIAIAKSLIAAIIAGGGIAIIIIIIAVIVAGMFGSAFGLLFSNETPKTEENMSVNSAVNFLDQEIEDKISLIKATTDYDSLRIENRSVVWREVLSVYAVITTNRENKFDIMKMDDYNYDKLKEIFWEVVEIDHYTETYKVRVVTTDADGNKVIKTKIKTRLIINVEALTLDEMMEYYNMNKSEKKQVDEMMNGQFDEMWNLILLDE